MLAQRLSLAVLLSGIISSCGTPSVQQPEQALANTVWVPRSIAWVRPHPGDAELGHIQYAAFTLLAFRAQGQCLLISSTHSLGEGDTIIIATEPGVRLDSGRYRIEPNQLVLTSKNLSHTFTPPNPGKLYDARTDTLPFTGNTLVYKGIAYRPYTKLAGRSIHSFWAVFRSN